jgi:hypothetical protein
MESVQSDGKSFSLKDKLFNKTKVEYLSNLIKNSYNIFDKNNFDKKIMKTLLDLELKEKMTLITNTLYTHLPKNFNNAVDIMINSLPKVIDGEEW